jgi:hypothetical protein
MMTRADIPWIGLLALVAMFVLPFLPSWLFEGPRTIKHNPSRHVCAVCGAPWTDRHVCEVEGTPIDQVLRAQLLRRSVSADLERRIAQTVEPDD